MTSARMRSRRRFLEQVVDRATGSGWTVYQSYFRRGRGFPDVLMHKTDDESGKTRIVAAQVELDGTRRERGDWLNAFVAKGIESFVWRPSDRLRIERVLGPIYTSDLAYPAPEELEPKTRSQIALAVERGLVFPIENASRADRAELRRMRPESPETGAFWRLAAAPAIKPLMDVYGVEKAGLLALGIAETAHGNARGAAHYAGRAVGHALFHGSAGYERRKSAPLFDSRAIDKLLSSRGSAFLSLWAEAFRRLGHDGASLDWGEAARLVFNEGFDETEADESRREIALAYYREEYSSSAARNGDRS